MLKLLGNAVYKFANFYCDLFAKPELSREEVFVLLRKTWKAVLFRFHEKLLDFSQLSASTENVSIDWKAAIYTCALVIGARSNDENKL